MDGQVVEKFQEHFGKMKDSRVERTKLYPLEEILFVLLCGSICGAETREFKGRIGVKTLRKKAAGVTRIFD